MFNYFAIRVGCGSSFVQIKITLTQGCFVPSLNEIGPVVLEKILKSCECAFTILQLSPLKERHAPSFNQI